MHRPLAAHRLAIATACAFCVAGCRHQDPSRPGAAALPRVVVAKPVRADVVSHGEFAGRIEAVETVRLHAPVEGVLLDPAAVADRPVEAFREGSRVKRGQLLFVVGRNVASLGEFVAADVARRRAEANLEKASEDARRAAFRTGASAAGTVDGESNPELAAAENALQAARTALRQARTRLDCVEIRSPIDGVVGRRQVDPWNLVGRDEDPPLAEIVATDSMYVYFDVAEADYAWVGRRLKAASSPQNTASVEIGLEDDHENTLQGKLDFLDARLDPATDTALARAVVPNLNGRLHPGMSVRVRVPLESLDAALTVQEQAIRADAAGRYLLVVNETNSTVERRYVDLTNPIDARWVVRERSGPDDRRGIAADEFYIVDGHAGVRIGMPVAAATAEEASPPADPTPAPEDSASR